MREIKFRAWDTFNACFHYSSLDRLLMGATPDIALSFRERQTAPLEQYTGLKDKDGVEIYEGDIIKIESRSYGVYLSTVVYREMEAGFVAGGSNKQLEMPDKPWDRKHDPCNCDGAMYDGWRILRPKEKIAYPVPPSPVEVVGNIHENPELLAEK